MMDVVVLDHVTAPMQERFALPPGYERNTSSPFRISRSVRRGPIDFLPAQGVATLAGPLSIPSDASADDNARIGHVVHMIVRDAVAAALPYEDARCVPQDPADVVDVVVDDCVVYVDILGAGTIAS